MSRRIGILGGTFDPIHLGHVDLGLAAERALHLTRLFIIPANLSPHRSPAVASAFHRFAMVALAVSRHPRWQASDLELRREPPSFTSTTLQHFHDRGCLASELFFVIGADAFVEIESWNDYPSILEAANFAVVSRRGCPVEELPQRLPKLASRMVQPTITPSAGDSPLIFLIDAQTADVSSTAIRQCRADGRPIAELVDRGVLQHIEQHGLYTPNVSDRRHGDERSQHAAGRLHGEG